MSQQANHELQFDLEQLKSVVAELKKEDIGFWTPVLFPEPVLMRAWTIKSALAAPVEFAGAILGSADAAQRYIGKLSALPICATSHSPQECGAQLSVHVIWNAQKLTRVRLFLDSEITLAINVVSTKDPDSWDRLAFRHRRSIPHATGCGHAFPISCRPGQPARAG
jgi:hypothetical protein